MYPFCHFSTLMPLTPDWYKEKNILSAYWYCARAVFILTFAAIFWIVAWRLRRKRGLSMSFTAYFFPRMILTTVQICYYLYALITATLFKIFSCAQLDTNDSYEAQQYLQMDPGIIGVVCILHICASISSICLHISQMCFSSQQVY